MASDGAVRFRVAVTIGTWRGLSGTLAVFPKRLVLDLGTRSRRIAHVGEVVDEHDNVRIILARLLPHIGVRVVITGGTNTAEATFPRWRYRRLLSALEWAGISPDVRTAWFSGGPEHRASG